MDSVHRHVMRAGMANCETVNAERLKMQIVESFDRETIKITKGYRARKAGELLAAYPTAERVDIAERGNGAKLQPDVGTILYIMSTGGKWGRSSEVRVAYGLETAAQIEAKRAAAHKAERDRQEAQLLKAELSPILGLENYGKSWGCGSGSSVTVTFAAAHILEAAQPNKWKCHILSLNSETLVRI